MVQKKKLAVPPEPPQAKKKARSSAEKAIKKWGGGVDKLLKVGGKSTRPKTSFPIVGIGASAGELEALELFLANVPIDSGMAFLIVQQLIPPNKDMFILNGMHLPVDFFIPIPWQEYSGKPY